MPQTNPDAAATQSKSTDATSRARRWIMIVLGSYLVLSYVFLPFIWREFEKPHPAISGLPRLTQTKDEIPGDPLNIGLIGAEQDLSVAMIAAGWHAADPLTLESCARIVGDTILRRPYSDAPVSNLYVWGRKQDLAFEQPVGHDPRQRHHIRFWHSETLDEKGRPLWIGAATYDTKVGLSHTTGQITHHISPDVDAERDKVLEDLRKAEKLVGSVWLNGFHKNLDGHNGGGDRYHTDGRLVIGTLLQSTSPAITAVNDAKDK